MWLLHSSIGRKVVMSITGMALVIFLLFHLTMNLLALFSADAYNRICAFLGANWYAVIATVVLGALTFLHIIYSILLTIQNNKARGKDRYAVNIRPKGVNWASQNMFILGSIVGGFLVLHLYQFWRRMMFAELLGHHEVMIGGSPVSPQDGYAFICYYFSRLWVVIAYLIWYVALWFHLTHGFWSAFQSIGLSNHLWLNRLKTISNILATLIMLGFMLVTITFYISSFQFSVFSFQLFN
jgi:succinate dehydrogenase / fumarate reductase cytochrome b subunit